MTTALTLNSSSSDPWTQFLERIHSHPKEAQIYDNTGYLPIHHACEWQTVPLDVIESLYNVYPKGIQSPTKKEKSLPLHLSIQSNQGTDLVELILELYPDAVTAQDIHGRTPFISCLLQNEPSIQILQMLINVCPNLASIGDTKDWYPIHYAVQYSCSYEVVQYLISLNESSIEWRNDKDETAYYMAKQLKKWDLYDVLQGDRKNLTTSSRTHSSNATITDDPHTTTTATLVAHTQVLTSQKTTLTTPPSWKQGILYDLQHNLTQAESLWNITSVPTQSILHRVVLMEQKIFETAKEGGIKPRIYDLLYVNGRTNGTFIQWIEGMEMIIWNQTKSGSLCERIEQLEWIIVGKGIEGNIKKRMFELNEFGSNSRNHVPLINHKNLLTNLLSRLSEAEAMWNVLPLDTQSFLHRISTLEKIIFQSIQEGDINSRLLSLVYVEGTMSSGTYGEWVDGMESLIQNEKQKGSIVERIQQLEWIIEGEVKSGGSVYERIMELNQMNLQRLE